MSRKFILKGHWYYIDDGNYKGRALFVGSYSGGTLHFLCDDGETGYFMPDEVMKPAPIPSIAKLQELLLVVYKKW
jgi:hypothetical protein